MGPFASAVCDFISELPYTNAVSYARLWQKQAFFIFSCDAETTPGTSESTYHIPYVWIQRTRHFTAALPL